MPVGEMRCKEYAASDENGLSPHLLMSFCQTVCDIGHAQALML